MNKKTRTVLRAFALLLAVILACVSFSACSGTDTPAKKSVALAVNFETVAVPDEAAYYAVVTGYDSQTGETVWTHETPKYYVAQLDTLQEIGLSYAGYFFLEEGTVTCLDLTTGEVLWQNSDFDGAGAGIDMDMDGTIYLCGYFGPDLYVISPEGKTIARYDSLTKDSDWFEEELFWPYEVKAKENGWAAVSYESDMTTVVCDVKTGEIMDCYPHTVNVTEDFLAGTWVDDKYDTSIILTVNEDMSYVMTRYDEAGDLAATYYGTVELGKLYAEENGQNDGDWLIFRLEETDDDQIRGMQSIGDYVVCEVYETDNYCYIVLAQVNNGDSMISLYFNAYSFALEKVEAMG